MKKISDIALKSVIIILSIIWAFIIALRLPLFIGEVCIMLLKDSAGVIGWFLGAGVSTIMVVGAILGIRLFWPISKNGFKYKIGDHVWWGGGGGHCVVVDYWHTDPNGTPQYRCKTVSTNGNLNTASFVIEETNLSIYNKKP